MRGRVKWFNNRTGWGFIQQDQGTDIYVHHEQVAGRGYKTLQEGDLVEFELREGERGPYAVHVTPVGPGRGSGQEKAS